MKGTTRDIEQLLTAIAPTASLSHYTWHVQLRPSPPTEAAEEDRSKLVADVITNGLRVDMSLYPLFVGASTGERIEVLLHEVAHVMLRDLNLVAHTLAGKYAEALVEPEERICDAMARVLYKACMLDNVDFTALSG